MVFFLWFLVNGTNSREDTLSYLPIGFSRRELDGCIHMCDMYLDLYVVHMDNPSNHMIKYFICHSNKVSLLSSTLLHLTMTELDSNRHYTYST